MKKMTIVALSILALASLSSYANADETAAPANQTEVPAAATLQNNSQAEKKQSEKIDAVKEQKSEATEKTEKKGLPNKKVNSAVGGRGIKLPVEAGVPGEKTKAHDDCSCDPTAPNYCGRDAC